MLRNRGEVYVQTYSGDMLLVEVEERHGWVSVSLGDKRYDFDVEGVYDLVDILTMVANDMSSYLAED